MIFREWSDGTCLQFWHLVGKGGRRSGQGLEPLGVPVVVAEDPGSVPESSGWFTVIHNCSSDAFF